MQVADFNQFGSTKPGAPGDPQHCAQCEAMLTDALDGTLSAADQATFDLHMVGCPTCSAMLADAQRGAAWMELLKSPRPEPSASLVERILAQTSNPPAPAIVLGPTDRLRVPTPHIPNTLLGRPTLVPAAAMYAPTNVLPFRARFTHGLRSIGHTMLQPRLAMTAAMAFFSIALTLNLTGVRVSSLRASDLKPSSILRSASQAKASVVRYTDNLRVVYELESRVRDLQRSSDDSGSTSTAPAPQNPQPPSATPNPDGSRQPDSQNPGSKNPDQKKNRPKSGPGSSRREAPGGNLLLVQYAKLHSVDAAYPQASVSAPLSIIKQEGGLA
jgi:Putative zinc-finger